MNPVTSKTSRPVSFTMFAGINLGGAEVVGFDFPAPGTVVVTFSRDLTTAEAKAVTTVLAAPADVPAVEAESRALLVSRSAAGIEANRVYLALTSPTAEQTAEQIKALTRQMQALTRLALDRFEDPT